MLGQVAEEAVEDRVDEQPGADERERPPPPSQRPAADRRERDDHGERVRLEEQRVAPGRDDVLHREGAGRPRLRVVEHLHVAEVPVDGHDRHERQGAGEEGCRSHYPGAPRTARPDAGAPGHEHERRRRQQPVRQLHRGCVAEQDASRCQGQRGEPLGQQQGERHRDECRRERLGIEVQAGVDEPLAVGPGAVPGDRLGQQRPGGHAKSGQQPEGAAPGGPRAGHRGGDDTHRVCRQRQDEAEPEGDVRGELPERPRRQHRQSPQQRPADHGGARGVHLRDAGAGERGRAQRCRHEQPRAPLRSSAPLPGQRSGRAQRPQRQHRDQRVRQPAPGR